MFRKNGRRPARLPAETDPKSAASEAYRALRTNIQFAGLDHPCRIILVTSATAAEGKTTSVANFGVVAAQGGARVCLVDSDLRRPTLHHFFDLDNSRGLTSALVEDLPLEKLAQPTRVPNLYVVPSGALPPNPAELVGSRRMREHLQAAAAAFDLVVCDSPPVIAVSDGLALAAQCDGVILTVRVGGVSHEVIRRAVAQLEAVKGRILGVVLNGVDFRRDGYYYGYYRYSQAYTGRGPALSAAATARPAGSRVTRCRAVTLDCWGTLLLDGPGSDERYRRQRLAGIATVLERAGRAADGAALGRAYDDMARRLGGVWREHRDVAVSEHVRLLLSALDRDLPGRLGAAALADVERAYAAPALLAPPALDPGARGALAALAGAGLRLGVVSNVMRTPGSVLREIFARAGVLAAFGALTFSDECGVRKPAPGIFCATLDRLGVAPGEAVHVGDDPVLDVEGALDAGLRAILVSADRRATSPVRPHAVIASLEELPMALFRLTDRG